MTGPLPQHLPPECFACETFAPHRGCLARETFALPVLMFRETAHGQA